MSLAERLEQGPPTRAPRCPVCLLLGSLPDVERDALAGMLASPQWSDAKTFQALKAEGHLPHLATDQALGAHRRRCV